MQKQPGESTFEEIDVKRNSTEGARTGLPETWGGWLGPLEAGAHTRAFGHVARGNVSRWQDSRGGASSRGYQTREGSVAAKGGRAAAGLEGKTPETVVRAPAQTLKTPLLKAYTRPWTMRLSREEGLNRRRSVKENTSKVVRLRGGDRAEWSTF